jgi:hypothetical protein
MRQPRIESAIESRRGVSLAPDLPKREPVDEKIMPVFNRLERGRTSNSDSTFADHFDPGKNGVGDGGCD